MGDDEAGERGADRGPAGEGDVEDRVAGPKLALGLEEGDDDGPGQGPAADGQGPVEAARTITPASEKFVASSARPPKAAASPQ